MKRFPICEHLSTFTAVGTALLLTTSLAQAAPAASLCAVMDRSLRASLQLSESDAQHTVQSDDVPGGGARVALTCTWTSEARDRSLTVSSTNTPVSIEMPASCNEQRNSGQTTITCMTADSGPLVTLVLSQTGGETPADLLATVKASSEQMARRWGKALKQP